MDDPLLGWPMTVGWRALLWKESAALRSYWLAMLTVVTVFGVDQLLGTTLTLAPVSARVQVGAEQMLTLFVFAFAVGQEALRPELRGGHIRFLDGLPTHRAQVYTVKVVAALLPSLAAIALSLTIDLAGAWVAPGAPGADPVPALLLSHAVLLPGALAGLGLGLVAAWLGPISWAVLGFGWFVGLVLAHGRPPMRPYTLGFDAGSGFGAVVFDGPTVGQPLGPVWFWSTVGGCGVALAGLLFLVTGASWPRTRSPSTRLVGRAIQGFLTLTIGGGGVVLLVSLGSAVMDREVGAFDVGPMRVLHLREDKAVVREVTADLEALSAAVGALIGNEAPVALDVEFLGAPTNHLGVFTGGRIRLKLHASRHTLTHELAHAHAHALETDAVPWWVQVELHGRNRFFDEGLATWVERRLNGLDAVPQTAAMIHRVDPVGLELLVESAAWSRRRDAAQVYPLGAVFVEALDQLGGVEARRCVLRSAGPLAGKGSSGLALWVQLGARCGFELDALRACFEGLLDEAGEELPTLPRLAVTLVDDHVLVRDLADLGVTLICRFRSGPRDDATDHRVVRVDSDGRCPIPVRWLAGGSFEFQVGFYGEDDPVFEPWTQAWLPGR